jgi:hypothetical protein
MMITKLDAVFGREARHRLTETAQPGMDGALAALETFYHALNRRDTEALRAVWLDDKGWRQIHHHGSIDKPHLLQAYQDAVTATTPHQSAPARAFKKAHSHSLVTASRGDLGNGQGTLFAHHARAHPVVGVSWPPGSWGV